MRGASAYGGTGGSQSHTHTDDLAALNVSGTSGTRAPGTNNAPDHSHSLSDNTCSGTTGGASSTTLTGGINAADHTPQFIEVIFCVKD